MTETLKHLMHDQADSVDFAAPDLGAITRAGSSRVRRRRGLTVVGSLAALAVVGGVVVTQLGGDDGAEDLIALEPLASDTMTWTTGSVLHTPTTTRDLGHPVAAYVRTTVGFAFTDGEGGVYTFTDGEVARVGDISQRRPRLVGDADGTKVGWVDPTGSAPTFTVLDLATGDEVTDDSHTSDDMGELADSKNPAYFYELDGDTAYWRDSRGAVAVDLATGDARVVAADALNGFDLVGAENGRVLRDTGDDGLVLDDATGKQVLALPQVYGSSTAFSPDGRYVTIDADYPQVFDLRTGDELHFDVDSDYFATGYEWLDDDTLLMVAAASEQATAQLLTCSVASLSCDATVPDLGTFDELAGRFSVPNGITSGD